MAFFNGQSFVCLTKKQFQGGVFLKPIVGVFMKPVITGQAEKGYRVEGLYEEGYELCLAKRYLNDEELETWIEYYMEGIVATVEPVEDIENIENLKAYVFDDIRESEIIEVEKLERIVEKLQKAVQEELKEQIKEKAEVS